MLPENINNLSLNFIICAERTGSTLLSTMLNMHSNILSTVEEPFAYSLYPKYKHVKDWTDSVIEEYCYDFFLFSEGHLETQFVSRKELETELKRYKGSLHTELVFKISYLCFFPEKDKSQVTTIVDKQLIFHTVLEDVAEIYPDSKFIVLYRDPRDNAVIRWKKAKRMGQKADYFNFAFTWNNIYRRIQMTREKIGSQRFLEVTYEELMEDPAGVLKGICDFLGLPFQYRMLEHETYVRETIEKKKSVTDVFTREHFNLMHHGLTQKVNKNKIGIWKNELTDRDKKLIWSVCGDVAKKAGYKKEGCPVYGHKSPIFYLKFLNFMISDLIIPRIYFKSPFFLRYLVKKYKYARNFKERDLSTAEYFKANLER